MDLRSSLSSPNAMESPMLNDLDGKYFVCEFYRNPCLHRGCNSTSFECLSQRVRCTRMLTRLQRDRSRMGVESGVTGCEREYCACCLLSLDRAYMRSSYNCESFKMIGTTYLGLLRILHDRRRWPQWSDQRARIASPCPLPGGVLVRVLRSCIGSLLPSSVCPTCF